MATEMKAAHTPGPWTWFTSHAPNGEGFVRDTASKTMRILLGSDGQGFAWTVGLQPAVDVANADLLTAAPDMLEALESIENDDGSIPAPIWAMRNAAIARARGTA